MYESADNPAVWRRFAAEDSAVSATEYAILLALLIIGSMSVIAGIGRHFSDIYVTITGQLPDGM